jgi:hypothetical protein
MTFDDQIGTLARAQAEWEAQKALLLEDKAALEAKLKQGDAAVADLENTFRNAVKTHFLTTGDRDVHPAVTFRVVTKIMYDKDVELARVKEKGQTDFIRVKEELKVREWEKAYKDGSLPDAQVEEVVDVVVAIGKLGEWVE